MPEKWKQLIYGAKVLYLPGPRPPQEVTPEQLKREREWRLVCHNCGHRWPKTAAINPSNARCCGSPNIHIHNTLTPCEFCEDADV